MRYTISEMAALLGVTTHTLRYYEKMGLIQPEVNRETGYRYYTVTDTRRFNLCRELRARLALHEGVPAEQILCGSGAADLIFRLVWAKKAPPGAGHRTHLCGVCHCFEKCRLHGGTLLFAGAGGLCGHGCVLCGHPSGGGHGVPLPAQQPHRPADGPAAGGTDPPRCAACGTLLVVDECFLDFLPDHALHTAKGLLGEGDLVILKAFTKLYGMAGVRLGYALSADTALLEQMQACGQPWGVSSLAQAAGLAALEETAYVEKVRALIAEQRPRLTAGLRALGLRVLDGRANYLLFQAPETLGEALRQRGAVLRSCANYPGLGPGWYRTAVRTGPENEQLLKLLAEVLE